MSPRLRSRALLAAGACALVVVGALIGVWLARGEGASPRRTMWGDAREKVEYRSRPEDSARFVEAMTRLRNELPYRSSWTDDDAAFVVFAIETDVSDVSEVGEDAAEAERRDAVERMVTATFAILVASHSLGSDVEMSASSRARLEAMLVALLEDPDPYFRRHGLDAMFVSGLIERDTIYEWVNEVAASDPDKPTREKAAFLLNRHDMAVLRGGSGGGGES